MATARWFAHSPLAFQESSAYDITCAPGGRLVLSGWGHERPSEPGPYRTTADMAFADSSEVTVLREGVLAEDRLARSLYRIDCHGA